jgi:hypothetical protein
MAVGIVEAECRFVSEPPAAAQVPGALPDAFRRAFRTAALRSSCARGREGAACRGERGSRSRFLCREPASCAVPLIYGERAVTGKQMPPAVQPWSNLAGPGGFTVRLVLFGDRAVAGRDAIVSALEKASALGIDLRHSSGRTRGTAHWRFSTAPRLAFEGTLRTYTRRLFAHGAPERVVIELATPCIVEETATAEAPSLGHIAGNLAYDLALYDIHDRREAEGLGREQSDAAAERAREVAEAAFAGVRIEAGCLAPADWGRRQSGSNKGVMRLRGLGGYLRLAGDLDAALPWLAAMTLRGAGQKKSYGAGEVRLWRTAAGRGSW